MIACTYMLYRCTGIFFICLFVFFLPIHTIVGAVKPAPILAFGGAIVGMVPCTCSGNILLYVLDARKVMLPLVYQPGVTFLYKWYQPRAGVWGLGNFVPGGVCLVNTKTGCVPKIAVGTMIQLGTSMGIVPGK